MMKFVIEGREFSVPDKIIIGVCRVCKLPLVTYEVHDFLIRELDDEILFHLTNVCDDMHEICMEDPSVLSQS